MPGNSAIVTLFFSWAFEKPEIKAEIVTSNDRGGSLVTAAPKLQSYNDRITMEFYECRPSLYPEIIPIPSMYGIYLPTFG